MIVALFALLSVPIDAKIAVIHVPIFCPNNTKAASWKLITPLNANACRIPTEAEEKEHHKHLKYIKSVDTRVDATFGTSAINLQNLRNEIQRMLEMARVNVEESFDAFLAGSSRFLGDVDKRED